jgi:hypothetical protein
LKDRNGGVNGLHIYKGGAAAATTIRLGSLR